MYINLTVMLQAANDQLMAREENHESSGYIVNCKKFEEFLKCSGDRSVFRLSQRTGIHRATIAGYLNGSRSPFATTFLQLSKAIGANPFDLIATTDTARVQQWTHCIIQALAEHHSVFSKCALLLFGSRSRGKARKYSDLDLGITGGDKPLTAGEYLALKRVVDEVSEDFPVHVDFVNLDFAPPEFLEAVIDDLVFLAGDEAKCGFLKGVAYGIKKKKDN